MMGKSSGMPSDVYSFGVILWELATLKRPYESLLLPNSNAGRAMHTDLASRLVHLVTEKKVKPGSFSSIRSPLVGRLMLDCCDPDPLIRPLFRDIGPRLRAILDDFTLMKEQMTVKRIIRGIGRGLFSGTDSTSSSSQPRASCECAIPSLSEKWDKNTVSESFCSELFREGSKPSSDSCLCSSNRVSMADPRELAAARRLGGPSLRLVMPLLRSRMDSTRCT